MTSLESALKATHAYARYFDYDLTREETHHWLISPKIFSLTKIPGSNRLSAKRRLRLRHTQTKLVTARSAARILSLLPTIRLIAVTGSLAVANTLPDADIDLLIICQPHSLWLTRLLAVPLLRLFFKSRHPHHPQDHLPTSSRHRHLLRDALCPNLWLDTTALTLPSPKRNLYTAHEVLQIKPLINKNHTFERFILANSWTQKYLATAFHLTTLNFPRLNKEGRPHPSPLITFLNHLAFKLQYLYMRSKITSESVSLCSAYFHPRSLAADLDRHLANNP